MGTVVTYGDIAKMLGRPRAARFVGYAMNAVCENDNRPWHRVTFNDGRLWDGQWAAVQRKLLKSEGVGFIKEGKIDVEALRANVSWVHKSSCCLWQTSHVQHAASSHLGGQTIAPNRHRDEQKRNHLFSTVIFSSYIFYHYAGQEKHLGHLEQILILD